MRTLLRAILAAGVMTGLAFAPAFALNARSGMPHEPISKAGQCAKANGGWHIPYRGWRTRDRIGFLTCMWF